MAGVDIDGGLSRWFKDPQDQEARMVTQCDGCGKIIREGDDYYDLPCGYYYCEKCIRDARKIAELE